LNIDKSTAWGDKATFDWNDSELPIMREAWRVLYSAGINFIDTTQEYRDVKSEEIVGDLIASVSRDTVVVQTRYYPMPMDKDDLLHHSIAPVKKLRQSLKRMELKYVDVNLVHGPVHP
jgi:aryl-alcohol dehydrogenase-like predicted oxidoreductase